MSSKTTANLIILGFLAAEGVGYLLIPITTVAAYDRTGRSMVYALAVVALFYIMGMDERPVPKRQQALLLAVIGVTLYFAAMFVTAYAFGYAKNGMAPSMRSFYTNLWVYGSLVFLSELLRYKMIRSAPAKERAVTAVCLTLVYTFVQLGGLRSAITYGADWGAFFFASVFPALALNAVLSYVVFEGSFASALLLRATYTLSPVLLPYLPDVSRVAWAAISCAALFVTVIVYHMNMSDRSKSARHAAKRLAKYQKFSPTGILITAALIVFVVAFNARVLPYYPVVVLTGSMEGAFDRGSIVFIEKVETDEVLPLVQEGEVIHFLAGRMEIIHRVMEFRYNAAGERVYITKGDANSQADGAPVETEQVLGICRSYIPYIGWPVIIINSIFST